MAAKNKSGGARARASAKAAAKTAARPAAKKAAKKTAAKKTTAKQRAARKPAAASRKRATASRRQPESLRLRSVGPSLTVADIQKSLAFYRDVLGFVEKERWEHAGVLGGVELAAGSVRFWIGQDDWKKGRDRVKGVGFRMYCTTSQDIDVLATQIKARGGELVQEPRDLPWGGREIGLVDPDGFAITIARES